MKFKEDKELYLPQSKIKRIFKILTFHPDVLFYKAIKNQRNYQYAKEKKQYLKILIYGFFANHYASKYNIELYGKFGKNLKIWHGNIIINSNAILGDNVSMHGNNCIGNNLKSDNAPKIGNNVDIGFGSVIIGDVTLADNIIIGANSLVNKSFLEANVVIAGNPAKIIKRNVKNDKDSCNSK